MPADPSATPIDTEPFRFTENVRKEVMTKFVECLCQACHVFRMPIGLVDYSERELALAVAEAEIDLQAMYARRSRTHGIPPGKIAGILAFRLARFKIVHFKEEGWDNANMHLIQELAALFLARRLYVKSGRIREGSMLELAYQLSRRHANQETLGVFFDAVMPVASGRNA